MTLNNNIYFFVPIFFLTLYVGKFLLLPLFFSLFIFIILKSLSKKISLIKFLNISLSYKYCFILVSIILIFLMYFFGVLLKSNIEKVTANTYLYQANLNIIFKFIQSSKLSLLPISFNDLIDNINFAKIFSNILNSLTNVAGNLSLVVLYLIFLVIEEKFFIHKISKLSNNKATKNILSKINLQIFNYFQLKTFTSFLTGILTFFTLFLFENDLAIFFGILSFVLNFIPFIGSMISILIPFIFSMIQFLDFFQSFIVFILLFLVQIFIGNFVEPKLMGKSLNLSPIIMLITLSIMSKLWGISGMFLSIPILVILLIIFSNFKETKKIAVFLSEKGQIS
ncbi:MAG: hypothetical protein CMP41_00035 [Rickettsiales bacterium]|nr:hypothetical protein [Rickettsiales bacterium]|tara:strand:+ start:68 stop:1081 length:1014 start_codon:yes stop_codon:yes gene_type:complete